MKRMKSMYVRQVAILLGLTFLCMVLLGVGFFTLSYRYQLQEIQTTLDRNAGFISSYADAALTSRMSRLSTTSTPSSCSQTRPFWSATPTARSSAPPGRT